MGQGSTYRHIDHIRPWLRKIPVRRHRSRQFLARRTNHVPGGVKEQHAVIHMQAMRHITPMIQHDRTGRVPARCCE